MKRTTYFISVIAAILLAIAPCHISAQGSVGTPKGAFSVSPTGAATYTVSIDMPEPANGLKPDVAIAYNSQAGNGIVGYGCNITGISVITRGARDIYHDGQASGTDNTIYDAFFLDGKRIILDHPEGDPYTTVTLHEGSGYVWFEVVTPDGTTHKYGDAAKSRLSYTMRDNTACTAAWYITQTTDRLGNSIDYSYEDFNSNVVYPLAITYNTNTHDATYKTYRLLFQYESRPDVQDSYMGGTLCTMDRRLKKIIIQKSSDHAAYRSYEMAYASSIDGSGKKYSRLSSITEKNGSNESLPPVMFEWAGLPHFSVESAAAPITLKSYASVNDRQFVCGDLNGDGVSDVIEKVKYTTYSYFLNGDSISADEFFSSTGISGRIQGGRRNGIAETDSTTEIRIGGDTYQSRSSLWQEVNIYPSCVNHVGQASFGLPLSIPIGPDKDCGSWGHVNCGAFAADMYGSGSCNLAIPFLSVGTDNSSLVQIWVNEMLQQSADILYYQACGSVFPLITVTDFDNDGRHELFILEKTGQNGFYQYAFEYADESNAIRETTATIALPHDPTNVFVADYDNNGLQDIMILYEGGYKVYWGTGSHELFYLDYAEYSLSGKPKYAWEGDFNGDGCPDYLLTYTNNPTWYVAYGRGNGVLEKVSIGNIGLYDTGASQDNDKMTALVYDFDGDGLTDFVVADTQYGLLTKTYTKWYRSVGESFTLLKTATSNKPDDGMAGRYSVGDFDGDGYPELMNYGYDCFNGNNANVSPTAHVYPNPLHAEANGKVVAVHDGFDRVSLPVYTSLATGGVYAKGTGATYPVADIAIPLHVVKSATTGNGAAGTSTQSYEYGGLKVHLQGKGLLGFSTTSVTDVNSGAVTTSSVDAWDATFFVPAHTTKTTEVGGHTATEEVTMGLAGYYTNNKLAYPSEIVSEDFEGNVTRTVNTFSAAYGKPTAQTTYYGSGTGMFKKTEYGLYVKKGGAWLPQRVTHKQKHIDDGDEFSLTTKYTYDEQGLPTQVIENFGITGKTVTTDYTYDSCGRELTECTTGAGYPNITYTYGYTNGRLTSVTDDTTPVHTVWSYNDWGDLTAEVDLTETSSPLVNHYTYDGWNRQISTTDPTGITATTSWGWGDTQAKQYYVEEQSDSLSWSRTWYDSCGREVETESRGPLGVNISTQTEYDDRGQVAGTTSTIGDLTTWEEHEYDGLGRVTRTTTSSGSNSTFSYSGRTVTENRNGRTYSKTVDAWGNTVTATDPVSSVSYSYFSNGKPESATSEGSSVTMAYDAVGNQTSLTDPDAGTMTYTYDAAGHVVTQTDARGKVTENEYDSWGRLSKTTIDGEETTYTYGTTGRDRLRLKREQVGGNSIDYTHDQYGRILTETRTVDSTAVLSFRYTYNNKGQVSGVEYPENVNVDYLYDGYGNRTGMKVNNVLTWQMQQYSGKTSKSWYSGGLFSWQWLDGNGFIAKKRMSRGASTLHEMTFTHDGATGNLMERTGMFSYGEEFAYDDLDRLTSYTGQGGTKYITYEDNGNIQSHTDLGDYEYSQVKPHAVETVGGLLPGVQSAEGSTFTYNGFGKVSSINFSGMSQMSWRRLDFSYGPDRERWKTVRTMRGGLIPGPITTLAIPESSVYYVHTTNLYAGDYERIDGTSYYYLDGGVIYVKPATSAGQAYYALTDHLGSYTRLYTMAGDSVLIASYDPWGNCTTTRNTLSFHRGFTGHEHLTTYGVINMNGRMYDPTVGRFLAPDNFVQMPDFSQSFNRYSYCLNNPLKYTDPSGELFGIDDAFLIFALASSTISGMAHASMQGKNIWLGGLKGFASGALSVAGTAGIGQLLGHGIGTFGNEMLRGGLHGLNGGLSSVLDGGNFFSGFTSGAMSSFVGSGMQALSFGENSVLAATTALGSLTSGVFHNDWLGGAIQGFQVGMLNHNGPKLKKLGPDYYENLEYLPEVEVRGVHFNTYGEKPLKSVPVEFGILFSGKLYYNIVKGLYSMANSGVHAAYQELRRWVNNASTMSPDKLRSDLEKAGWRRASDRSEHYKRGKHIIRLDGPDKNTPYNHMHINRVDKYHAFDKDLNRVDYRSRQAHIRIKP